MPPPHPGRVGKPGMETCLSHELRKNMIDGKTGCREAFRLAFRRVSSSKIVRQSAGVAAAR